MSANQNNNGVLATCKQRLDAIETHVKSSKVRNEIEISGKKTSLATLTAVYQRAITSRSALVALRAAYRQGLKERDDAESARLATDGGLQSWINVKFGADSQVAEEFGFTPRKVGTRSAATVAKAVEQSKATREARHTLGKNQKKDIKGVLPTLTAPADPAPNAAPAPQASPPTPTPTPPPSSGSNGSNGASAH